MFFSESCREEGLLSVLAQKIPWAGPWAVRHAHLLRDPQDLGEQNHSEGGRQAGEGRPCRGSLRQREGQVQSRR